MVDRDADLFAASPVASVVIVAAVATVAYVLIQVILDGSVSVAETAAFVFVFTFVYAASRYYLGE
ncbi:MAG: hypothetical protein ABEJ89_03670 [Haloarculaceae archaeon]